MTVAPPGDSDRARPGETPRPENGDEQERATEPCGPSCELCGAPMLDRHCKLICLRCGYQRDCSDP